MQPLYLYSHSQLSDLYTFDAAQQDTDGFDVDESEFEIPPKPIFFASAKLLNLPVSIALFTLQVLKPVLQHPRPILIEY